MLPRPVLEGCDRPARCRTGRVAGRLVPILAHHDASARSTHPPCVQARHVFDADRPLGDVWDADHPASDASHSKLRALQRLVWGELSNENGHVKRPSWKPSSVGEVPLTSTRLDAHHRPSCANRAAEDRERKLCSRQGLPRSVNAPAAP